MYIGQNICNTITNEIKRSDSIMSELKRGDIWLVNLNGGIGSEQTMIRPVAILQNNSGNKYSPTVTIVPLTSSRGKKWLPTHVTLYKTTCLLSLSIALAEQVTTISKERFIKFIGEVNKSELIEIENSLMIQMGIESKNNIAYA